jgi:hypothetical protein
MAEGTCAVEGCDRPRQLRGWCQGHYDRWRRSGDVGPAEFRPLRPGALCAVEDCERISLSRGWCEAHYQRWRQYGDPGPAEVRQLRKRAPRPCSVDECERRHYGKGFCILHYHRWANNGDPNLVLHARWIGDEAGYATVHDRLRYQRGRAGDLLCARCGGPAVDWAYDGTCPNEKVGDVQGRALAYSTVLSHYMPLCRACHSRYDENTPAAHLTR